MKAAVLPFKTISTMANPTGPWAYATAVPWCQSVWEWGGTHAKAIQ